MTGIKELITALELTRLIDKLLLLQHTLETMAKSASDDLNIDIPDYLRGLMGGRIEIATFCIDQLDQIIAQTKSSIVEACEEEMREENKKEEGGNAIIGTSGPRTLSQEEVNTVLELGEKDQMHSTDNACAKIFTLQGKQFLLPLIQIHNVAKDNTDSPVFKIVIKDDYIDLSDSIDRIELFLCGLNVFNWHFLEPLRGAEIHIRLNNSGMIEEV